MTDDVAPHAARDPAFDLAGMLAAWRAAGHDHGGPLGVAVSGGGDSIALLHLMAAWATAHGRTVQAVTVDHGLRAQSAEEAQFVGRVAADLGVAHTCLVWTGWDRQGNLSDAARRARLALIGDWAVQRGIGAIALGHTADDQAETVLLRLARGSGVYGLSAMAPTRSDGRVTWLRPLLGVGRAALRDWLTARNLTWIEDPTNQDPAYARVRMRRLLPLLAEEGIDVKRLCETASAQARAAEVLSDAVAALAASAMVALPAGYLTLNRPLVADAPDETALRLLSECLRWVGGADYGPRAASLEPLRDWAADANVTDASRTLAGCVISLRDTVLTICREPARVAAPRPSGGVWDGRWDTPDDPALTVGALGAEGLAAVPDWRATGLPRDAALSLPGLWDGDRLIAAPFAMPGKDCHLGLSIGPEQFGVSLKRR